jgi:peptidoglycan/LPS O-acetylase OafA/YrhL
MIKYRPEIDGLRALAVLPVIFFHAGIELFGGGFVGVDVFFVISGFLITSIIKTEIDEDRFSFVNFYERRIRRIIPALTFVFAVTSFAAYIFLLPLDLIEYSESLIFANLFTSNILFWRQSGYFDTAAELKPLLHTWSLSVEEQFYLLFPFLLLMIKNLSVKRRLLILFLLCCTSFALCLLILEHKPSAAYYLLPTRGWEILIGSIAAYIFREQNGRLIILNAVSIIGMALIISSIFLIDKHTPFPGVSALMPTVGAVFVLLYAQDGTYVQRLLSSRLIVGVGLISYSLYLWHLPVIVFSRYYIGVKWDAWTIIFVLLSIFSISVFSWKFIEMPFRRSRIINRNQVFLFFSVTSLLFISLSYFAISYKGLSERLDLNSLEIGKLAKITDPYDYFDYKSIVRNGSCHSISSKDFYTNGCLDIRKKNIFIVGDSYAASLYPGLKFISDKELIDLGITQLTEGNAPPFVTKGKGDTGATLSAINRFRMDVIGKYKPNIVLLHWMPGGLNSKFSNSDVARMIDEQITSINEVSPLSKVIIIGPPPKWSASLQRQMISYYIRHNQSPPKYMSDGLERVNFSLNEFLANNLLHKSVKYISLLDILCNVDGCLTRVSADYTDLTAVDWGHLTRSGSIYVADRMLPAIYSEIKK